MRSTRLLRAVAQSSRYLEAGAPTGLTGLLTHRTPRSALIWIYNDTLEKLKQLPESSVYRQSTEALTKHRLAVIEAVKPPGLEEWKARIQSQIEAHPKAFQKLASQADANDINFVVRHVRADLPSPNRKPVVEDEGSIAEDGIVGAPGSEERAQYLYRLHQETKEVEEEIASVEAEPQLTADQIGEIENQIGAGLIEEIIQVAEGESKLVETLAKDRVWEELAEKPVEGQWTYHERDRHTPTTQAP